MSGHHTKYILKHFIKNGFPFAALELITDINYVMEVGMEVCDKEDSHNFDKNIF